MNADTKVNSSPAAESSWLDVLVKSLTSSQQSPLGQTLPRFPPEQLQRNTTGLASEAALRQAYAFYENVCEARRLAGSSLETHARVLDFGFGWGRIARCFMRDVRIEQIFGIDVDPEFVALTRDLFDSTNFTDCQPFPPAPFPDAHFDLISAYSVFSHLSEDACQRWMSEFARILKPGGLVVCTTRDDSFFDFLVWASGQQTSDSYLSALGQLFSDVDIAKERYRRGELVHASSRGVDGGGPRDSSFYGETWIPEAYARTRFDPRLDFLATYFDGTKYDQRCFAWKRRAGG
jgi:SAM-dependent methyltransferase